MWEYAARLGTPGSLAYNESIVLALGAAHDLVSPMLHRALAVALDVQSASVSVEVHRQLALKSRAASGCAAAADAWVDLNGVALCSASDVEAALAAGARAAPAAEVELFDFDRRFPSPPSAPAAPSAGVAVLYACMGTPAFQAFHAVLSRAAAAGSVTYVLRHAPVPLAGGGAVLAGSGLAGFSVTLDVKNMEYRALDDRVVDTSGGGGDGEGASGDAAGDDDAEGEEAAGSEAGSLDSFEDDVGGFLFKRLEKRHPSLQQSLREFKRSLLAVRF
jgi:hypothetical protein